MILRPSQRIYTLAESPIEINWASSLARGLVSAFVPTGAAGAGAQRDIARGATLTYVNPHLLTAVADPLTGLATQASGSSVYGYLPTTDVLGALPASQHYSLSFWASDTALRNTYGYVVIAWNGSACITINPYDAYSEGGWRAWYAGGNDMFTHSLNDGIMHLFTLVVTGATSRLLYIDGIHATTFTTSRSPGSGWQTQIGKWSGGGSSFIGKVGPITFWDRPLSTDEAWQIYDPATRWELYQPLRRLWAAKSTGTIPPPSAPSDLTATATASDTIALAWTDNSADETGFRIERSLDGASWGVLDTAAADATSYDDDTCDANTRYYYRVCAYNAGGDSDYTDTADAKTPPDAATQHEKPLVLVAGQVEQSDGRYVALADGVPEPDTVAGIAWLYVDQDDGDLKVKFGDGHTATLAADS